MTTTGPAPLVVILGETASGKTSLSIALAKQFNGEVICADSWTVYRGFDIGTAKPTPKEQDGIPHHLLDVADPAEGYSAAVFQRQAGEAISDISARGKLPIMVGGTGLYIDSVLYNYGFLPASNPNERAILNDLSLAELHDLAAKKGLDLSLIDDRNKRRVIRLIENNGILPTREPMRKNTALIGIRRDPLELKQRIIDRVDEMVRQGLADEVAQLGAQYGWECEPMKAPAYRAFREYVQGDITLAEAKLRMVQNDLKLAKKQRTWFKRNKDIHWITPDAAIEDMYELIKQVLNK